VEEDPLIRQAVLLDRVHHVSIKLAAAEEGVVDIFPKFFLHHH
jgi:hypothetical protein